MNSQVKTMLSFIFGGLVGSGLTLLFIKKKYDQMYQDSMSSMEEVYEKAINKKKEDYNTESEVTPEILAKINREKPSLSNYAKDISESHEYVDYSKMNDDAEEPKKSETVQDKPYSINPADFGEFDNYGTIFLVLYKDGILSDDNGEILEDDDIENSIGFDYQDYFGEYEDDSVHIRNDRLRCDYEILADTRTYQKAMDDRRLV